MGCNQTFIMPVSLNRDLEKYGNSMCGLESLFMAWLWQKTSAVLGIKHGFSCINIRQVPREVLKTAAFGRGFQHLPRDLANINALKKHVRSLLLHKR